MGLDAVELVMRCEEVFAIDLPHRKLNHIHTVGDLYVLICGELKLTPYENPKQDTGFDRLPRGTLNLTAITWNSEDVWATLVAVFVDQLCLDSEEVTYIARIGEDLRVD
jgi:hypothetical protein